MSKMQFRCKKAMAQLNFSMSMPLISGRKDGNIVSQGIEKWPENYTILHSFNSLFQAD